MILVDCSGLFSFKQQSQVAPSHLYLPVGIRTSDCLQFPNQPELNSAGRGTASKNLLMSQALDSTSSSPTDFTCSLCFLF